MIPRDLPPKINDALRTRFSVRSIVPIAPGMSGAAVFRCESVTGDQYALKRWPSEIRRNRIDEVHRVIRFSHESGYELVPRLFSIHGQGTATQADGFWELSQWMPGEPIADSVSIGRAKSGAAAITRFHASANKLGVKVQSPPAAAARLERIGELAKTIPEALKINPADRLPTRLAGAVSQAQLVLRARWRDVVPDLTQQLAELTGRHLTTQYALRDAHRSHVLFQGEHVSGIIDFDAIRIDTPAADFARWAGSLIALSSASTNGIHAENATEFDPESIWKAVLAGLKCESSSNNQADAEQVIDMARTLHNATTWASLANWVVWLLVDGRRFPAGEDVVRKRILEWTSLAQRKGCDPASCPSQ